MIRKVSAVAGVITLALGIAFIALPATDASAAGARWWCVGIRKLKGYNALRVDVGGNISGGTVRATGSMRIYQPCDTGNTMPITKLYFDKVTLRNGRGQVLSHVGERLAIGKSKLVVHTPWVHVRCGTTLFVKVTMHLGYYNGTSMQRVVLTGPQFARC